MSTFARRLAIPADQAYARFTSFLRRKSAIRDYAEEYQRAMAAAAEYDALKRLSQAAASDRAPVAAKVAREVWRRHYA
jgi:hypothetical protein